MKGILWAMVVRDSDIVCVDVPGGLVVSERKSSVEAAVRQANQNWRSQDPARKNKPGPWGVAKYARVP